MPSDGLGSGFTDSSQTLFFVFIICVSDYRPCVGDITPGLIIQYFTSC